jgi:uncharacterized membrane protein YoaK (UPF0700 family)
MVSPNRSETVTTRVPSPSVDNSLGAKLLPGVLSVIAGSVDVISFLGLGGLFAAHITGNLVVLAAHIVTGKVASLASILSVPVFIAVLGLTRLAAAGLENLHRSPLRPLLALQLLLLVGFLAVWGSSGTGINPTAPAAIVAGMLGVAAMAVQNALARLLVGAPATAVMTTDITTFVMDIGAILFRHDRDGIANARSRAKRTWPAIVGFTVGCSLGAVLEVGIGPWSLALSICLALLALVLGFSINSVHREVSTQTH